MQRILVILTLVLISTGQSSANSASSPKAIEILKLSQQAAAQLQSISYEAKFWGEGMSKQMVPMVDGKVLAKRGDQDRHKVLIEGTVVSPRSTEAAPFRLASDGVDTVKITENPKVFLSGKNKDARSLERNTLFPPLYLGDSIFETELASATIEYEGQVKVEDVECHVIQVNYEKPRGHKVKLYLGKEDHLLRRTERPIRMNMPGQPQGPKPILVYNVKNLKVNPEVDDKAFQLKYTNGYEKKDFRSQRNGSMARRQKASGGKLQIGSDAPDWTLTSATGEEVSLKSLRGKIVVLDFWATWCGPCKMAMPGLQKLHEKFKDQPVAIFGVNCREKHPNPMAYIKKKGYTYGQLLKGNAVASAYGVGGIPAFYIIDKDGKILHIGRGFHPQMEAQMGRIIEEALKNDA